MVTDLAASELTIATLMKSHDESRLTSDRYTDAMYSHEQVRWRVRVSRRAGRYGALSLVQIEMPFIPVTHLTTFDGKGIGISWLTLRSFYRVHHIPLTTHRHHGPYQSAFDPPVHSERRLRSASARQCRWSGRKGEYLNFHRVTCKSCS